MVTSASMRRDFLGFLSRPHSRSVTKKIGVIDGAAAASVPLLRGCAILIVASDQRIHSPVTFNLFMNFALRNMALEYEAIDQLPV